MTDTTPATTATPPLAPETPASRDAVVPGARWQFDASVAECFDDMLAVIPWRLRGGLTAPSVSRVHRRRGAPPWPHPDSPVVPVF